MKELSPIVLFVYNRLIHTKLTIEALQKNELANQSELFIYSDGAKNEESRQCVNEVRTYIDSIDGFKKITVIKRRENWGLANSIINGVTKIVNEYGKIIVLEDDLITSPYFLKFMNEALEFYKNEEKVWHISGWNYPIDNEGLSDTFCWRGMNCWGWATWDNRWSYYKKDVEKTIDSFSKKEIYKFNIDGVENLWGQVISNKKSNINTWAIFWYAMIFKKNGFCVNPSQTFVKNIGNDGSGINCNNNSSLSSSLSTNNSLSFNVEVEENKIAFSKIREFYKSQKKPFLIRCINKIARTINGKNIIK